MFIHCSTSAMVTAVWLNLVQDMSPTPKVTVIVAAYNSAKTIEETLESISYQSLNSHAVEVILTDDKSSDNTLHVMRKWLSENIDSFSNIRILSRETNVGTVRSINSAVNVSRGEWIKLIAADDILHATCLEVLWNNKDLYPQAKILCGICEIFITDDSYENRYHSEFYPTRNDMFKFELSALEQLRMLRHGNFIYAPAAFFCGDYLRDMNGFDEQFTYLEDYPFWVKVCSENYPIRVIEDTIPLVGYRVSEHSVSNANFGGDISRGYNKDVALLRNFLDCHSLSELGSLKHGIGINLLSLISEVERRGFKKVIVYGASGEISTLVKKLINRGLDVLSILDNDEHKNGIMIEHINVVNVDNAFYEDDTCFIINSISYKYQMIMSLRRKFGMRINKNVIITNNSSLNM